METRIFLLQEKEGKKIGATENGSRKSRCESKSSAVTTLFSGITSQRELIRVVNRFKQEVCRSFQTP